jgi:asparagine synthase (glutamine-hydrolysing)
MCGIAGHVNWAGTRDSNVVRELVARLRHRGPDDAGTWSSPDGNCTLGHARLSILDLSSAGHQPMIDPYTGNAIAFNGEIYNFAQLRRDCERDGERFRSGTDTEVILALYRRYGIECLQMLRGMFAFALWDAHEQHLVLARDRLGKKPLNYCLVDNGIVLASEIHPLMVHPAVKTEIDPEALELYLQLQYVPAPWTIYKGIRKLPAGHYAIFSRGGYREFQYWDVDYNSKVRISEADALDALEERLTEAVRLRMIADVPLGALLSGGVDSSVIVAIMARLKDDPVRTFSIGFDDEEYNELAYAEMVAKRYETDHHPRIVEANIHELLPTLIRHYGEPFADSSAVPSFLVSRTAREHVTVVMNGDGGDELLGGYPRYTLSAFSILSSRILGSTGSPDKIVRAAGELAGAESLLGRARRKWLYRISHPEVQSVGMYANFWNDKERASLLSGVSGRSDSLLDDWRSDWLGRAMRAADNAVDRMLWLDNRTYLNGDLLVKMDIATMHCGLEARSPLLDHELIEFAASLPVHLKVRGGVGKYLLKKLGERFLPRELLYRRKMGFAIPLVGWLRGPLQPLVRDVLGDRAAMHPLNPSVIATTVEDFYKGSISHSSRIWALLMFGLWQRANSTRSTLTETVEGTDILCPSGFPSAAACAR